MNQSQSHRARLLPYSCIASGLPARPTPQLVSAATGATGATASRQRNGRDTRDSLALLPTSAVTASDNRDDLVVSLGVRDDGDDLDVSVARSDNGDDLDSSLAHRDDGDNSNASLEPSDGDSPKPPCFPNPIRAIRAYAIRGKGFKSALSKHSKPVST